MASNKKKRAASVKAAQGKPNTAGEQHVVMMVTSTRPGTTLCNLVAIGTKAECTQFAKRIELGPEICGVAVGSVSMWEGLGEAGPVLQTTPGNVPHASTADPKRPLLLAQALKEREQALKKLEVAVVIASAFKAVALDRISDVPLEEAMGQAVGRAFVGWAREDAEAGLQRWYLDVLKDHKVDGRLLALFGPMMIYAMNEFDRIGVTPGAEAFGHA